MWRYLFERAWDFFVEVFGASTWEQVKSKGWIPMLGTIAYAGWSVAVSPLGPVLFVTSLGVFAIGLWIVNEVQTRRIRRKQEQGELLSPQDRAEMEQLRAKLATIEDKQPRLVDEPVIITRKITAAQQPRTGFNRLQQGRSDPAFFALLRVKNLPKSTNQLAIAREVYAEIFYYDAQWERQLFPSVDGIWVAQNHTTDLEAIGYIFAGRPNLKPNESIYLGIAIGYFLSSNRPCEYAAVTASSPKFRDWVDVDVLLGNRAEGGLVNIKTVLSCHGFRTSSYYILQVNKTERNFTLTSTSGVQHAEMRVK